MSYRLKITLAELTEVVADLFVEYDLVDWLVDASTFLGFLRLVTIFCCRWHNIHLQR